MHLINPLSSPGLGYPPTPMRESSPFHAIPSLRLSPVLQDLQHKTQKAKKETARGTTCAECSRTKTTQWHTNPQDATTKICKACYDRILNSEKLAKKTAKGSACAECSKTKTSKQWYTNAKDPTTKICSACYQRVRAAKESAKGTVCPECSRIKTNQWHTNPRGSTTKICHACYQRIRNKAEKTAKKRAALSPTPPPVVSAPLPRDKRKKNEEAHEVPPASHKRARQSQAAQNPQLQMDLPSFFQPHTPDEELLSLFSIGPRESLEESGLPELENTQQLNDPNEFLLEDSSLYDNK